METKKQQLKGRKRISLSIQHKCQFSENKPREVVVGTELIGQLSHGLHIGSIETLQSGADGTCM